ncbi:hypothetical protein LLH23_14330 [bacterium]|nr:hypothetical protein [bacterium]
MSNAPRLIALLGSVLALALIMTGCVKRAPTAPPAPSPLRGATRQQQAAELRRLALKQAQAVWPSPFEQYAPQWAKGISQAIMDTGTEPLSEQRMAALREAVTHGAADAPQPALREYYVWRAAAARYNYAELARLPDLTPRQMQQIDRQVDELAEHVTEQVRRTLAALDPAIADEAGATAAREFTHDATRGRTNPSSVLLKQPLLPDQIEQIKQGFDTRFAQSDGLIRSVLRAVKDPEKRGESIARHAQFTMMAQITALSPRPQYPEDVLRLEKAYADAYMATRNLPGK